MSLHKRVSLGETLCVSSRSLSHETTNKVTQNAENSSSAMRQEVGMPVWLQRIKVETEPNNELGWIQDVFGLLFPTKAAFYFTSK